MLNSVIMMGRLTAEPELRRTQNDIPVTSFTIAVERSFARQGAERQTDFFDVVAWNKQADFACKLFHKGQLVAVPKRDAYAGPSRDNDSQVPPAFSNASGGDFEEITTMGDDLPF